MAATRRAQPLGAGCACMVALVVAVVLQGAVESREQFPKPKSCDASETWFRHRRRYIYNYKTTVEAGFVGASDIITGSVLSCDVTVSVPKRCEITVELSGCKLKERGLDGKMSLSAGSKRLANQLERHELYVQMDRGQVLEQQVVVNVDEPVYVINIKRAIVSQLQLPILPKDEYDKPVVQHDLFGACPTRISFDAKSTSVFSRRDVTLCTLPQVFGRQASMLSFTKQFQLKVLRQPLDAMFYPFESQVDCQYKVGGKKISRATCLHTQAFKPITFGGELRAATSVNVTQSLSLAATSKIPKRKSFVSRNLKDKKVVSLTMELQVAPPQDVTSSRVHEGLDEVLITYSAQSDDLPPEKFRSLVDILRDAPQAALEGAMETLLMCRGAGQCPLEQFAGQLDPKVVQKLREAFFIDGLLSCGTEACVATYMTCLQRGLVQWLQGELALFNLALFYRPHPAALTNMMTLCRSKSSNNCWLSLGTLVNRMAEQVRDSQDQDYIRQGKEVVRDVLQHLRVALGDVCRPGILAQTAESGRHEKLASLLVTLKSLGNAGGAIQEFHDELAQKGKDIVAAVTHCLNNPALPHKITSAAITVLQTLEVDKKAHTALSDLLSDPSRPVSLRTMAFDRLVLHEDIHNVDKLIDIINGEKLSSLKIYMVTRVSHLLESNLPRTKSLRALWRSTLEQKRASIPQLEELRGRGSQYAELSRYIELPLSKSQHGARLGLAVVFEPASIVPSNLRLSLSFLLDNRSMDLLDVGLDLRGFENIARELLGPGLNLKQGLGALIARVMQAMLPQKGEVPTLFFPDKAVAEALRKLFVQINMPTGDTPQAQFRVKVFGSEVGFVYLEDLIRMVKSRPASSDKEPPPILSLAQRLAEGLQMFFGKSTKLVEFVKLIPTVAGLPWHAEVHVTTVASAMLNAGGDVIKFITRKGPLEISGGLTTSVGVKVTCQETVRIGDVTSSGLGLNVSVLVNSGLEGRMKYAPIPDAGGVPGAQVLELGLAAIKRPLNIFRFRSDMYHMHNGQEKAVKAPDTRVAVRQCGSDFVQQWTGQKVCVEGFHPRLDLSADAPLPFLSGPIHLDVTARSVDKSLEEYTATFTLTRRVQKGQPGMLIVFKANCSAPGDRLKRKFDFLVNVNPTTRALHVLSAVPELGLRYGLDLNSTYGSKGNSKHHLLSSVLTLGPKLLHSFIMEGKEEKETKQTVNPSTGKPMTFNESEMEMKVNVSVPGLSVQVISNSSSWKKPGLFTQGLYVRYYCEPELGILYAVHSRPRLAAQTGHVSEWSISNVAIMSGSSLAETWRARDTLAIHLPGYNVTLMNKMVANYTWASRNTTIYWTSEAGTVNETTDIIRMESEVRNESVGRHYSLHYVMHLDHEHMYDIMLKGSLLGALSDLNFNTTIAFTSKANRRDRRSLRGIYNRLKRVEEDVEEVVETAEEMVVRRGAELTEGFLHWMAGDSSVPSERQQQRLSGKGSESTSPFMAGKPRFGSLVMLFKRPQWKLDIDANLKIKPKMEVGSPKPVGYDCAWDMDISLPDQQKDVFSFSGTLSRGKGWNVDTDWRLHSDVLNFTLSYFLQQTVSLPRVYHLHRWNLVAITKHRYDRSFTFLMDLERHDHFLYSVDLVSPRTNLSHSINFSTIQDLRVVRASMDLHNEFPSLDIKYREMSSLTPKRLKTDVTLNSTWLDLTLDMDVDWSTRGALFATQHFITFGKVPYMNGSSRLDVELKMNLKNRRRNPTLTITHNSTQGHVSTALGQLLDRRLVHFTFFSRQPGDKKVKLLSWYIRLLEPTLLHHNLQWGPHMTQTFFNGIHRFYTAGAHSFRVFGQTVADNIHRNITDMVVPFTNSTISQTVDRVVQGQLKQVAMSGLDPKKNVPLKAKVLKGGLKVVQSLQTAWQNSAPGKALTAVGIHRLVSGAIRLSTRLHYMMVQDPPFPLRQYIKFRMMPGIAQAASSRQFNFTVPLPFVWDHFLSLPKPRMLRRQVRRRAQWQTVGGMTQFPYLAIITRDQIQTFDGISYDITVPRPSKCTYLLATDLVTANHSVLLSHHSAALALRHSTVALAWDGAVNINHDRRIVNELPANLTNDRTTVTLTEGQLTAAIAGQLRMTYDPISEIYVIETAMHVHNRSLGLLGTNTYDPGDDFLLPTGQIASGPTGFQEKYELSGRESCQNVAHTTSSSACDVTAASLCTGLFQQPDSPLAACFPFIQPQQFLDLCLRRVCEVVPPKPSKACPVVRSYIKMCVNRGQQVAVSTKLFLNTCGGCQTSKNKVDMVFGSALDGSGRSSGNVGNVIRNLAGQLEDDSLFGLVRSYGQHVHAHLFDGQLLVAPEELRSLSDAQTKPEPEDKNQGVEAILKAASNYPFRPDARHFIVLFTGSSTPDLGDVEGLKEMLWKRDISLVLVSSDLDRQRVLSVTWDQQVMCRGCSKDKVFLPNTGTGKLAAATRGLWMSLGALEKGRRTRMRKLLKPFQHVAKQPSPQCAGVVTKGA